MSIKIKTRLKPILLQKIACLSILCVALVFSNCQGGTCSATDDGLADADSDCAANAGDNCPSIYNPSQFDGDSDGVGEICDVDDTDPTVALMDDVVGLYLEYEKQLPQTYQDYMRPDFTNVKLQTLSLKNESCYLVGCDDIYLGALSANQKSYSSISNPDGPFGNPESATAILNTFGFFGRHFTACSAFNPRSQTPPVIYCSDSKTDGFAGYLTLNSQIESGIDTCQVITRLGLESRYCD